MAQSIPILLYHSVIDKSSDKFLKWTVSPKMFASHLAYLRGQAYTPITVSKLVEILVNDEGRFPKKMVLLTFDDGFEDFYINALPILETYGFPATLYITAGYIGRTSRWLFEEGEGDKPIMTWPQIQDVTGRGVEIGAHSLFHPNLDIIGRDAARSEVVGSKAILEDGLNRPIHSFAYPHGYHSAETRQLVSHAGYSSACAVKNSMSNEHDDVLALARIIITHDTDIQTLASLMKGDGLVPFSRQERVKTTAWRMIRRVLSLLRKYRSKYENMGTETL